MLTNPMTSEEAQTCQAALDSYVENFAQGFWSCRHSDHELVDAAIERLYRRMGLEAPCILWCDSPWQLATWPVFLQVIRSTLNEVCKPSDESRRLRQIAYVLNDKQSLHSYNRLIEELGTAKFVRLRMLPTSYFEPVTEIDTLQLFLSNLVSSAYGPVLNKLLSQSSEVTEFGDQSAWEKLSAIAPRMVQTRTLVGKQIGSDVGYVPLPFPDRLGNHQIGLVEHEQNGRNLEGKLSRQLSQLNLPKPNYKQALTWGRWSAPDAESVVLTILKQRAVADGVKDLVQVKDGAFMYSFTKGVVYACKDPVAIRLDDRSRLHNYFKPAVEFCDGYGLCSWKGVQVPQSDLLVEDETLLSFHTSEDEGPEKFCQLVEQSVDDYSRRFVSVENKDQESVNQSVERMYSIMGQEKPTILWCDSPWQLAAWPMLLHLFSVSFKDDSYQRNWEDELRKRFSNHPMWSLAFNRLIDELRRNNCSMKDDPTLLTGVPKGTNTFYLFEQIYDKALKAVEILTESPQSSLSEVISRARHDRRLSNLQRAVNLMEQKLFADIGRRSYPFASWRNERVDGIADPILDQLCQVLGADFLSNLQQEINCVDPKTLSNELLQNKLRLEPSSDYAVGAKSSDLVFDVLRRIYPGRLYWARWSPWTVYDACEQYLAGWQSMLPGWSQQEADRITDYITVQQGAFMYVFDRGFVFACRNPTTINFDSRRRLHSDSSPAVEFADGYGIYSWHGVFVEPELVKNSELLTIDLIHQTRNIEQRRSYIERFGEARYLIACGAKVIDRTDRGILYSLPQLNDEALVMVKVVNSTAEPDGTYKEYFLRVPPVTRTVQDAVAWTFEMTGQDYRPEKET